MPWTANAAATGSWAAVDEKPGRDFPYTFPIEWNPAGDPQMWFHATAATGSWTAVDEAS